MLRAKNLLWLGLHSLKEVSAGQVIIKDNPQLCYTQPQQWTHLFRSSDQTPTTLLNARPDVCGELLDVAAAIAASGN